jgi:hypothetical protein
MAMISKAPGMTTAPSESEESEGDLAAREVIRQR